VKGENGNPPMFDFFGLGQPAPVPFIKQNANGEHQDHNLGNWEPWV
jgi:hypothetical protein